MLLAASAKAKKVKVSVVNIVFFAYDFDLW